MKLRTLTVEETQEVMDNIKKRFIVLNEINKIAISILRREYEVYKSTFKYSIKHPFTFKAGNFQSFQNEICGGWIVNKKMPDYLGSFDIEFITHGYMYDRERVLIHKHEDDILRAAAHNSMIFRDVFIDDKFYFLLYNYAVRPFELSGDEYIKIHEIKKSLSELEKQLEDYKKCNNSI